MSRETLHTPALVLRSVAYRDADLIVTLYTRLRGPISAMARGARRSKRRFAGALGLYTVASMELTGRAGAELWTLRSAQVEASYADLAHDIGSYAHAAYATELVRELTVSESADARVFDLLTDVYATLADNGPAAHVLRAFELTLLAYVGVEPVLDRCIACGETALSTLSLYVDVHRGGVCCSRCIADWTHDSDLPAGARGDPRRLPGTAKGRIHPLPEDSRQVLLHARDAASLRECHNYQPPAQAAAIARDISVAMVLAHVGKPLRSLEFIAKLNGAARTLVNS